MRKRIIFSLVLAGFFCIAFSEDTLVYRIELTKDTIYFGEPIIVKSKLINISDEKIAIFCFTGASLLMHDQALFYLQDVRTDREYKYRVRVHSDVAYPYKYKITLGPKDSVYYYTILGWTGFTGEVKEKLKALRYEELQMGYYRLKSTYFSHESNVESIYGITLPDSEKIIFELVGIPVNKFWSGAEYFPGMSKDKTAQFLPGLEKVKASNSIFAPFCHYTLWQLSLFRFPDKLNAIELTDEFFKLYPNSLLAEKLAFDLFKYYAWHKKDRKKGREFILNTMKKYPNNLLGPSYLKRDEILKEEGLR